jgi:uncharacterized ParB-like nuclease family protein
VILKFITRLGIEQGTSNLYGLTPLAACQVRNSRQAANGEVPPVGVLLHNRSAVEHFSYAIG